MEAVVHLSLAHNLSHLHISSYHTVILLPLRLGSLTHKNPQRRKIIHGCKGCRMQRMIDRFERFLLEYRVISVVVVLKMYIYFILLSVCARDCVLISVNCNGEFWHLSPD